MKYSTSLPEVMLLSSDGDPGTQDWTQLEQEHITSAPMSFRIVRNVTQPTLNIFLLFPAVATHGAVIMCPRGFHSLVIDHEGIEVAHWLNARGVAAFALKYRLLPAEARDEDFQRQFQEFVSDRNKMRELMTQIGPLAIADAQQAMKVVRKHASQWDITPDQIGIMGFSAVGRVATGVALEHDIDSRPNFIAPMYNALREDITVPADAAPLFIALANDDELAVDPSVAMYRAWRAAHHPVELHIYAQGGQGFGMRKQGPPVDHWIDQFGEWLRFKASYVTCNH